MTWTKEQASSASNAWKKKNRAYIRARDKEYRARKKAGEPAREIAPFYRFLAELEAGTDD